MFVEIFGEHFDSCLYILKYCIPDHIMEDIRGFETLSVLDNCPYEQFDVHIKQAFKKP